MGEDIAASAGEHLVRIALLPSDDEVLAAARRLDLRELRTLDAIHLATAISIADDLVACSATTIGCPGLRILSPSS